MEGIVLSSQRLRAERFGSSIATDLLINILAGLLKYHSPD